jgi:peptidylprolyl isomerase
VLALSAVVLAACSTGSHHSGASASSSASGSSAAAGAVTTKVGVSVSGDFGSTPTLTIPSGAAPSSLTQQVLSTGSGPTVKAGDTLVANYVGQTWAPKAGKPNVFDSSFQRGQPAAFVIGKSQVIPGWDKTIVGKTVGSRMLLTVPPADGYGSSGQSSANISGTDTLVFVVDLVATYPPGASAPGKAVANVATAGLPKIADVPGKEPKVLSVTGVKAPKSPVSTLLVTGTGEKIDTSKTLVLELVETDIATGKQSQSTWQTGVQTVAAQSVLGVAAKLSGQNIGSRAVVLVPAAPATAATASQAASPATPASVLIIDVVGQF